MSELTPLDAATPGEILIVDDTPANLRVLSQLLAESGYRVRVATNGAQGLRAAQLAPPDLILLDVMMPDMNGYDVCRHLQAASETRSVPVLFISALDATEEKLQAFEAGGVDYITKPFQAQEVLARVRTHITRRRAELALTLYAKQTENARREADRQADRLAILNEIALAITSGLDLDRVLLTLHERCCQFAQIDSFYAALYHAESGWVNFRYFIDNGESLTGLDRDIRARPGLTGRVIMGRSTIHLPDTESAPPDLAGDIIRTSENHARTFVGVPLILQDNVVGVLSMQSYQPNAYTSDQIRLLEMVANQAAIAIQNSRLYEQIQLELGQRIDAETSLLQVNQELRDRVVEVEALQAQLRDQAIRDPLTRLFNRRYLEETLERELARAERHERPLGLIMIDVDHFKTINDAHGHKAGDQMLKELAVLMESNIRREDFVCRYGGEEFVIVMPGVPLLAARDRAEKIRSIFAARRVVYEDAELSATLSMGVSFYPHDGHTSDQLLGAADQALYAAKAAGRNCVRMFNAHAAY